MSNANRRIGCLVIITLSTLVAASTSFGQATPGLVTREASELKLAGQRFRFAGANIYWLGLDDNLRTNEGSPTYPTEFRVRNALDAAVAMNLTVVRSHTLGISVGSPKSLQPQPLEFSDAALKSIDYAIEQAGKRKLKLIIPLTDQWRYYHGGKSVFVHWAAKLKPTEVVDIDPDPGKTVGTDFKGPDSQKFIEQQFYTNDTIVELFKLYISHLLNHVNPYTGIALRHDPTILAWEIGNELFDAPPQWTQAIAAHIKHGVGAKQLVADGSASAGNSVANAALEAVDIDIVGGHYYEWPSGLDTVLLSRDAAAAKQASKVFVVGEWGWSLANRPAFLAAIEGHESISGDLFWSLLPYQENGIPEPHATRDYGTDDVPLYVPGVDSIMKSAVAELTEHGERMSGNDR